MLCYSYNNGNNEWYVHCAFVNHRRRERVPVFAPGLHRFCICRLPPQLFS